jgi:hypothetical protein
MGNVYNLCRVYTIMTVVLTVMSGVACHTIRVTRDGMAGMLSVGQSCVLVELP